MIYHICFGRWWYLAGCSWKTCPGKCTTRWAQNQITHSEVQSPAEIFRLFPTFCCRFRRRRTSERTWRSRGWSLRVATSCSTSTKSLCVREPLFRFNSAHGIMVMLICEDDDDYNEWCMAGSARQSPWRSSGSSLCSSPWEVSDVDNYRDNADHEDRDNHPDNPDCFLLWAGKPSASASYSATT